MKVTFGNAQCKTPMFSYARENSDLKLEESPDI
mgnify:CR=1 FL=1